MNVPDLQLNPPIHRDFRPGDIIAAIIEYIKTSKLFQTNAGTKNPLIVKKKTPSIGSAF